MTKRTRLIVLLGLGACAVGAAALVSLKYAGPTRGVLAPPVDSQPIGRNPQALAGAEKVTVVSLKAQEPDGDQRYHGLLLRELARQTVLIAARDGLGLSTRDQVLREPFPQGGAEAAGVLSIETEPLPGESMTVTLLGPGGSRRSSMVWEASVPLAGGPAGAADYIGLLEQLEPLSRGAVVDAMGRSGFSKAARPATGPAAAGTDAALAEPIAEALADLSFVSQYDAVRRAHAAVRSGGESPALLGALVRGYANLGQMADIHWDASHKVYWARALLYAQRMIAAEPASPAGLWHRAYAAALCGLHADALEDLESAKKLAKGGASAPWWLALLEPYCKFQIGKLANLAGAAPEAAPLGAFLCFLAVENCGSDSIEIEYGKAALEVNPTCLRVIDAMCQRAGGSYGHALTEAGPAVLAASLDRGLPKLQGLPDSVKSAIPKGDRQWADPRARAKLARALVDAGTGDGGEPSWAVLGRAVQELHFIHAYRRAFFMTQNWSVPVVDYQAHVKPLLDDHPYGAVVSGLGRYMGDHPEGVKALVKDVPFVDIKYRMHGMFWRFDIRDPDPRSRAMALHTDGIAGDLRDAAAYGVGTSGGNEALIAASPYHPTGIAHRILRAQNWDDARAAKWEKDHGEFPPVRAALANKYIALDRPADAERNLKRYIAKAPDHWAYKTLAELYLKQGDEAKWLATLEEFLKQEDYGLSHAHVRVAIARHFMDKGDYDRAEPYAAAAAESWARWAMHVAIECYEKQGDWKKAEMWVKRIAERYTGPEIWLNWCQRTGRGDLAAAQRAAGVRVTRPKRAGPAAPKPVPTPATPPGEDPLAVAAAQVLDGQTAEATVTLRTFFDKTRHPAAGVHLALLLDEAGDVKGRNAVLRALHAENFAAHRGGADEDASDVMRVALIGEIIRAVLTTNPPVKLSLASLDATLDYKWDPQSMYFAGKYLSLHGNRADAEDLLSRCAKEHANTASGALAAMELKKKKTRAAGGGDGK